MPQVRKAIRHYTDETVAKVRAAFEEIDARGDVVMPSEIARMIGMHRSTVGPVLRDAPWWTLEHARKAHRESIRRSHLAQAKRHVELGYTGRGYSVKTAIKVRAAFEEIDARGDVVMPNEIARLTGLSRGTVAYVLRDASWWTPERSHEALKEALARGAPGRAKAHAAQVAAGYPGLQKGRATLAALGFPNLRKAQDVLRAAGFPGLCNAARYNRSRPQSVTHPSNCQGKRTRLRLYSALVTWDDACDGRRSTRVIARVLGITTIRKHLHRLRADGLIDANNRVIAPWPESDEKLTEPVAPTEQHVEGA